MPGDAGRNRAENAEIFRAAGGEALRYIPCLNDAPAHADALAALAERALRGVTAALREIILDTPYGRLTGLRGGDGAPRPRAARLARQRGELGCRSRRICAGIDLVALDLPGHGTSPHLPVGAEYSLAGTVHTVLDAADALGWERFAVARAFDGRGDRQHPRARPRRNA